MSPQEREALEAVRGWRRATLAGQVETLGAVKRLGLAALALEESERAARAKARRVRSAARHAPKPTPRRLRLVEVED